MPDRIDYEIDEDWDIGFTDWQDLRTVHDVDVLTQNFVLLAARESGAIIGEQLTATKLSRFRKRLESAFRDKESVDAFYVDDVFVEDRKLEYSIVIGSDEYSDEVRLP